MTYNKKAYGNGVKFASFLMGAKSEIDKRNEEKKKEGRHDQARNKGRR